MERKYAPQRHLQFCYGLLVVDLSFGLGRHRDAADLGSSPRGLGHLDMMKVFIDQGNEPPEALVESLGLQTRPPERTYQPLHLA